jgi:hypothetical protein
MNTSFYLLISPLAQISVIFNPRLKNEYFIERGDLQPLLNFKTLYEMKNKKDTEQLEEQVQ